MRNSVMRVSAVGTAVLPLIRGRDAESSANRALCQALSAGSVNPCVVAYHAPPLSLNAIRMDSGDVPRFLRSMVTALTLAEVKLPVQRWLVLNVTSRLPAPVPPVA